MMPLYSHGMRVFFIRSFGLRLFDLASKQGYLESSPLRVLLEFIATTPSIEPGHLFRRAQHLQHGIEFGHNYGFVIG